MPTELKDVTGIVTEEYNVKPILGVIEILPDTEIAITYSVTDGSAYNKFISVDRAELSSEILTQLDTAVSQLKAAYEQAVIYSFQQKFGA